MGSYEDDPAWPFLRQSQEQLLAATTKKFDSKKNVWVADPEEGFVAAEIKSSKGDNITIVTSKGNEKTIKKDEAQQMNPPKYEKTEDMANLTFLNDASVLHNLRQRYFSMMIYVSTGQKGPKEMFPAMPVDLCGRGQMDEFLTYSGLFCVVINPYKRLPIYSESVCQMYMGRRRNEMPPHLFAVSDEAYRNMKNDHENQSMLITGESGAGKTENTKKVISYFAMVGATQSNKTKKDKKNVSLEDQIVQTNPVLEAFGNAKTVRNNNSSRFGKFIRIHFNKAGKVAGGDIEHYLLEKSRVIKQAPGERCYHIFYQMYSGAVKGLKERLMLTRPLKEYHFVAQAEITIDGVDDKEEMLLTDKSPILECFFSNKTKKDKKNVSLEDQIVQTNPVLEAFGNAKTVRNNNSSRFGKFIRIHFNKAGKVAGGDIEHYLLEKSRVIKQAPGERCYHIFYQMYSGAVKGLKERLMLTRPLKEYHFVAQAEITIDGVDDKEEMLLTDNYGPDILEQRYLTNIEIIRAEMKRSIMHMGELKFKQRPREEQAELEDGKGKEKLRKKTLLAFDILKGELACKLYNCDYDKFISSLLKPRVKVGTEWVNKGQNLEQVNWAVGALAKALYARMFSWLIKRCNKTLDAQDLSRDFFIGVLDIAGFEIFDHNSFEQLWINFVNEKLQQFFNHHMFVLEQEEYSREGIQWEFIDFGLDLQACIELIEKPLGVISMLDEECIVPKATDLTLASKLNDQHLGKHPNFQKPRPPKGKQAEAHLAIVHYAGTVRYNVKGWLEKNKDPLNDTAVTVLKANQGNQLMSDLWADYNTQEDIASAASQGKKAPGKKKVLYDNLPSGKSASFMTVSMMYRESLNNLMHMLHQTHPHFIRCIIPNEQKKSDLYQNKVFFKAGVLAHLEELRDEALSVIITKFQCACRHYLAMCDYKRKLDQKVGLLVVQRNVRAWCTLRTWHWFKLYGRVKPLIKGNKKDEEMEALAKKLKELEESHQNEERKRKDLEAENARLQAEKQEILIQLEQERDGNAEIEERSAKLLAQKADIEKQNADLNDQLADQEDRNASLTKAKKKVEQDNDALKKTVSELETTIKKQEQEKQSKDHQIPAKKAKTDKEAGEKISEALIKKGSIKVEEFQCGLTKDEIASQDEAISKINKERKNQEEVNRKLLDDIQAQEDKVNHINKVKAKLESTLDELEDSLEREKRNRQDVEKQKRKVEGELKIAHETIEEITRVRHDQENLIKKKESEIHSLSTRLEDEQSLVAKLQRQIKELQARIQELEEELEAE
ncbi:myosin head, partial [Ancylostoma duodenale]